MFKRKNITVYNQKIIFIVLVVLLFVWNVFFFSKNNKMKRNLPKNIREKTTKSLQLQNYSDHQYKVRYLMSPKISFDKKGDKECKIKRGKKFTMVTFIKS